MGEDNSEDKMTSSSNTGLTLPIVHQVSTTPLVRSSDQGQLQFSLYFSHWPSQPVFDLLAQITSPEPQGHVIS